MQVGIFYQNIVILISDVHIYILLGLWLLSGQCCIPKAEGSSPICVMKDIQCKTIAQSFMSGCSPWQPLQKGAVKCPCYYGALGSHGEKKHLPC